MTTYRTCKKCNGTGKLVDRRVNQHPDWKKVHQALELRAAGLSNAKIAKKMKVHTFQVFRYMQYAKRPDYLTQKDKK